MRPDIDKAVAAWIDAGDGTLRHMLNKSSTSKSVQEVACLLHFRFLFTLTHAHSFGRLPESKSRYLLIIHFVVNSQSMTNC
jgi:hypothetical protein